MGQGQDVGQVEDVGQGQDVGQGMDILDKDWICDRNLGTCKINWLRSRNIEKSTLLAFPVLQLMKPCTNIHQIYPFVKLVLMLPFKQEQSLHSHKTTKNKLSLSQ